MTTINMDYNKNEHLDQELTIEELEAVAGGWGRAGRNGEYETEDDNDDGLLDDGPRSTSRWLYGPNPFL